MSDAAFFEGYRRAFGPLRQSQVDGISVTLRLMQDDPWPSMEDAAYFLATFKHECADEWWPIEERGERAYFGRYEPGTKVGAALGNTMPGDGYKFRGRGYVQLTGRRNYAWAEKLTGFPLVSYPDGMKWPAMSYRVAKVGMLEGRFTGKKLGDYPGDYVSKRRVINGTDRADIIAGYAVAFEGILRGAA